MKTKTTKTRKKKPCQKMEPAFTEKDLKAIWKERYNFCKNKLGLSEEKARQWADGTVEAIRQTEREMREE